MKKHLLLILAFVSLFALSYADEWKFNGNAAANLTQCYYSDDWAGTEEGNITWSVKADFSASKQLTDYLFNKNTLNLAYGQTHTQDKISKDWKKPEKSTDKIVFESLGLFTINNYVDPYVSFKYESQLLDKTVSDDVKMFNPTTLTESFGISRTFLNFDNIQLSSRFGAAFKQFINAHLDENISQSGAEFVTEYRQVFSDNKIEFKSNLNLYKAFFSSVDVGDDWEAVDVNWENWLNVYINEYVFVNLYVQWLYDKEIIDKGRLKETLGLGVTYKLF